MIILNRIEENRKKHYTTYADVDNDGKFDYIINETVSPIPDENGNLRPPQREVHKASDKENRSMDKILKDLMNPNSRGEKMRSLDLEF